MSKIRANPEKPTFFWRSYQKNVFIIFVGEILQEKPHKNIFGKFGKIRAKTLRIPQNLPAPTPMVASMGGGNFFKVGGTSAH